MNKYLRCVNSVGNSSFIAIVKVLLWVAMVGKRPSNQL